MVPGFRPQFSPPDQAAESIRRCARSVLGKGASRVQRLNKTTLDAVRSPCPAENPMKRTSERMRGMWR
jgi:hypothetical protein